MSQGDVARWCLGCLRLSPQAVPLTGYWASDVAGERGDRATLDVRVEPQEFVDAGDDVVVVPRITGRGRASGVNIDWRQGYIWTIRGGKGVRFRWFSTPAQALEAVGLSE
jgi:ketosteroid isomerase-like protein